MNRQKKLLNLTFIAAAVAFSVPVYAQETADTGVQTYERPYFDQYTPQTARDLIDRLPGFRLDIGKELRGFGAGAGNVLINGERPSSKTGGLEDALSRISADDVERIEIIRGSAGASESAGQSIVANIVTKDEGTSGSWELQLERAAHGKINVSGEFNYSANIGEWSTSTSLNVSTSRQPVEGQRISRDSAGELTLTQSESRPSDITNYIISSEAERTLWGGNFRINSRVRHRPAEIETERLRFDGRFPDNAPDQRQRLFLDIPLTQFELGADWSKPVAENWELKMLSVSNYGHVESEQTNLIERPIGARQSLSTFTSSEESFETVFRTTYSHTGEANLKPEFGGELAYNRLDSALALSIQDQTGSSEIVLPAANVVVEELRGEACANLVWKATPRLTIESGLAAELSEISVSGDADSTQSFSFLKPFASLIYDARPGLQFTMGARRSVGQLDFSDFAASASADDDRLLAGNPELGPDQTTRIFLSTDYRNEVAGSYNVEIFHEWRDDVLEQIILPSGTSGTANAGDGRFWGITATASLPIEKILPGARVDIETEFLDSTFLDPVTGQSRALSSIDTPTISIEFRQDVPSQQFAWGASYRGETEGTFFFTDEVSLNRDGVNWTAFVETTKLFGVKTNLEFSGIGAQKFFRGREFFSPNRSGVFDGSEIVRTERGMAVTLTTSAQF